MLTDVEIKNALAAHGFPCRPVGLSADWIYSCWKIADDPRGEEWEGLFLFENEDRDTFEIIRRMVVSNDTRDGEEYDDRTLFSGALGDALTFARTV